MLDKVLVDIAKEHSLKISKDTVFGLYRGQLLNLSVTSNSQYVAVISLDEGKKLTDTLLTKENKKMLRSKLKSMKLEVSKEAILFTGIPCGLREKTRSEKLRKMLDDVCEFLSTFQSFEGSNISNIVLLGSIPAIKTDDIIAKVKQDLKREREKEIDHQKGFLFASVGVIVGACIAGLASGLMNVKLNSDLNAFGKAIPVVFGASFLYQKFANGVDKISKILIAIAATLGFMFWEISRYATVIKYKGADFTFNGLVEMFQANLNTETVTGKFTLLTLGIILAWVFFFVKRTDTVSFSIDEGEFLTEERSQEFELMSKGNWYSGFLFLGGVIALFSTVFLSVSVHEDFSYFEYLPFLYIALIAQGILWFSFNLIRKKVPALDVAMKTYGLTKMPKWFDPIVTHFCLAFFSGAIAFIALWANMKFDTSKEQLVIASLLETYSSGNQCEWLDFKPEKMEKLSMRVCKSTYRELDKNLKANVHYKQGFLEIPYALFVSFPSLDTFESYLKIDGKIGELREFNILHFYRNDKTDKFKKTMKEWETQCESEDGAYCRFTAYILGENGEVDRELLFLNKGCEKKDAVSCYGLILHEKVEDSKKDVQLEKMKSYCDEGHGESCHYLGHSYENYKAEQNKTKAPPLYVQACKLGIKKACDH